VSPIGDGVSPFRSWSGISWVHLTYDEDGATGGGWGGIWLDESLLAAGLLEYELIPFRTEPFDVEGNGDGLADAALRTSGILWGTLDELEKTGAGPGSIFSLWDLDSPSKESVSMSSGFEMTIGPLAYFARWVEELGGVLDCSSSMKDCKVSSSSVRFVSSRRRFVGEGEVLFLSGPSWWLWKLEK